MTDHCPVCPFAGCPNCRYQGGKPGMTSRDEVESVHNKTVPFGAGNASRDLTTERLIRSR